MLFSIILHWLGIIYGAFLIVFSKGNIVVNSTIRPQYAIDKSTIIIDLLVRLAVSLGIIMMIFQVFIPVIDDIYNLFIHKKYLRGEYVVTKTDALIGRGAFILQYVNLQGIDEQMTYYFSSGKIREGHRYNFEILPHSSVILTSKEVKIVFDNNNSLPPPNQALKLTE